jgi:heme exporter protein A
VPEAVECTRLVRRFGERDALAGVELTVSEGERVLLTGPNGAGKTTLLRVLATILRPSAGEARVGGRALPAEAAAVRRLVGYAGHQSLVYPGLTPAENLRLHADLHGLDGAAAGRALALVGLDRRAGDRVEELSAGMTQRLGLARALLHGPALLLLDEPTAALDADGRAALRAVLGRPGCTALIATHEPGWFAGVADREVAMADGRVRT